VKKIALSALAVVAFAGAANAQNTIEFRWVERSGQASIAPGAAPAAAANTNSNTDATIWLVLEARLNTTDPSIRGLAGGAGSVSTNDPQGNNAWKLTGSGRINSQAGATSSPGFVFPTALPTQRGIFEPFRLVANLGEVATGVPDDATVSPVNANIGQIAFATGGSAIGALVDGDATEAQFGRNNFIPVYTFQIDFTNLAVRSVMFTSDISFTAFSMFDANNVPNSVTGVQSLPVPAYTVSIVPAPGAAALLGLGGLLAARRRRA